jgi:hypothetical protein
VQGHSSIIVLRKTPARTLIGDQVHLQNPPASARADHGRLL